MGLLVNGVWQDQWYDTKSTGGRFERTVTNFRHWITPDGEAGPSGEAGFKAERARYHLYVSLACPWAHRTLIFRKLKKLEDIVPVSVVHPLMREEGWTFREYPPRPKTRCSGKSGSTKSISRRSPITPAASRYPRYGTKSATRS